MLALLTVLVFTLPLCLQKEEIGRGMVLNNVRLCASIHFCFFLFLQKKREKEGMIRRKDPYRGWEIILFQGVPL
jgi:hypothetical protein